MTPTASAIPALYRRQGELSWPAPGSVQPLREAAAPSAYHASTSRVHTRSTAPYALIRKVRIQWVARMRRNHGLCEPSGSRLNFACHGPHITAVSAWEAI